MNQKISEELVNLLTKFYLDGCDDDCGECQLKGAICDRLYDTGKEIFDT